MLNFYTDLNVILIKIYMHRIMIIRTTQSMHTATTRMLYGPWMRHTSAGFILSLTHVLYVKH